MLLFLIPFAARWLTYLRKSLIFFDRAQNAKKAREKAWPKSSTKQWSVAQSWRRRNTFLNKEVETMPQSQEHEDCGIVS